MNFKVQMTILKILKNNSNNYKSLNNKMNNKQQNRLNNL